MMNSVYVYKLLVLLLYFFIFKYMYYMFMDTNCVSDKTFYPSCLMCKGTYCTVRCPMVIMFPFLISFKNIYGLFIVSEFRALEREKH